MAEYGIQISIKTREGTLINVRGEDIAQFDDNLSHAVSSAEEIKAAEAAFLNVPPPLSGQAMIEQGLGGVVIGEIASDWPAATPGPWPPTQQTYQPGPPAAIPQQGYQQTLCGRCGKAPICATCSSPLGVVPKSVKNGQYYIHEGSTCGRDHKSFWCNTG